MKKKLGYIVGLFLIIGVLGSVISFVASDGTDSENPVSISLDGTWLVYQCGEDLSRTEYLVFEDGAVLDFPTDRTEAFSECAYALEGSTLSIPELEMDFSVEVISDNNIVLTEPNTRVWRLLLVGSPDDVISEVTSESIAGEYDVVMVGAQARTNETITFTGSSFSFVQNGAEVMSSRYELTDRHMLSLLDLGRDYAVYAHGDQLLFIGIGDNGVWELVRK